MESFWILFSRFEDYINKSFNKTASLMAYSCQANAVLAEATTDEAHDAFLYGKHLGIAFQLVDDLLDFVSSADMLGKRQYNCKYRFKYNKTTTSGKPAAADLQLGLATAPVLFASSEFPQLHAMITRRWAICCSSMAIIRWTSNLSQQVLNYQWACWEPCKIDLFSWRTTVKTFSWPGSTSLAMLKRLSGWFFSLKGSSRPGSSPGEIEWSGSR